MPSTRSAPTIRQHSPQSSTVTPRSERPKPTSPLPEYELADRLLADPHDLIHKAVGWMVREVGKRDPERFETFLADRYRRMPRTMLRYAIERLPEGRRQRYLRGEV